MDVGLYNELVDIANEVKPATTLERLSEDKQKAVAKFCESLVETTSGERTDIAVGTIAAWAFCVGHEFALRHWSLWLEKQE